MSARGQVSAQNLRQTFVKVSVLWFVCSSGNSSGMLCDIRKLIVANVKRINANSSGIGREIIGRTSLLARDILQTVVIWLGIYEDFANIAHVLSRSCAYDEAFKTCLRTNHE